MHKIRINHNKKIKDLKKLEETKSTLSPGNDTDSLPTLNNDLGKLTNAMSAQTEIDNKQSKINALGLMLESDKIKSF